MKTRKILALLIAALMMLSMLPFASLGASAEVRSKISEVELTLPEPKAGNSVNLSFSSVEVKHHQTYKVVGLRWYKYMDDRQMGVEDGADTYFIGGNSYIVEIDLQVKGDNVWNTEYKGYDTDYSGINAKINGQTATVKTPPMNADQHNTITVSYEFKYLENGVVNYPMVTIPTPIAGSLPPSVEELSVGNSRTTWIPDTGYIWYAYENGAWRRMADDEHFAAGARYKVEFDILAKTGFCYNMDAAADYRNDGGLHIWGYINGEKRTMELYKLGENSDVPYYNDQMVFVSYEFTSCEAQYVDSVSFTGITAPSATQHPQYNVPSMTGSYVLCDDEKYTGGAEYNFVNGIQWSSTLGLMSAESVFEEGGYYSMSFFIKTFDTHRFTDWVEGSADVGHVDVMVVPNEPSVALVTISFAPCDGGVLNEVNISGIKNPVHGEAPDYEFTYGQGYDKGTSDDAIVWYDLTDKKIVPANGTFTYGHEYELRIILRSEKQILGASTGKFEFASHDALTVKANGIEATKLERYNGNPEANWVLATIPFECEKHTIEQVVITVENPTEGKNPATQLGKGDETYDITGFMFVDTDTDKALNADDVFAGNKCYRFVLAVAPKEGFTFAEGITEARVNGQDAGVIYAGENGALICYTFIADDAPYCIVTFSAGEGTGYMSDIYVKGSVAFTLPECEFEAPNGKHFIGWSNDGGLTVLQGTSYVLEGIPSMTLTAVYVDDNVDPDAHQHIYTSFNACDDTMHWKLCIIEGCSANAIDRAEQGNHNYDNDCDDTCDDCGYVRTKNNAGDPLHFYPYACSEVCPNCGLAREAASHTPGAAATCTEAQKCTVCNKVLEDAKGHIPGDAADCGHDQSCTACGEVLAAASGEHTPGDEATCTEAQKCTVCDAEIKPANGHSAGVEWICDEEGHHKMCACGEQVEAGEHADEDGDGACDVCGYDLSTGCGAGCGSGCGSFVGVGSLLVIVSALAGAWLVIKKKD